MMRPNRTFSLLSTQRLAAAITQVSPSLRPYLIRSNVVVFAGDIDTSAIHGIGISTIRLLDYYYIAYDPRDQSSIIAPQATLFDLLADHYEDSIDIENNLSNIRELLSIVTSGLHEPTILDYGCGSGLSRLVADNIGVRLIGYDRSAAMIAAARSHGLNVLDPIQLRSLPAASLDGLIASYVLHLVAAWDDLLVASSKVRHGGRVAANFHKGLGLQEAIDHLSSGNFLLETIYTNHDGRQVAVWKRNRT